MTKLHLDVALRGLIPSILLCWAGVPPTTWAQEDPMVGEKPQASAPVELPEKVPMSVIEAAKSSGQPADALKGGPLEGFAPFIGQWEIRARWEAGTTLWSFNQYEVGPGGRFVVARTFAKDGDGDIYERYNTYFAHSEDKGLHSYGFTYDGSVTVIEALELFEGEDGKPGLRSQWQNAGTTLKQEVRIRSEDTYGWQVWARQEGQSDWVQIMDGEWHRRE